MVGIFVSASRASQHTSTKAETYKQYTNRRLKKLILIDVDKIITSQGGNPTRSAKR